MLHPCIVRASRDRAGALQVKEMEESESIETHSNFLVVFFFMYVRGAIFVWMMSRSVSLDPGLRSRSRDTRVGGKSRGGDAD